LAGVEQDIQKQIEWLERQPLNPVKPILDAAPILLQSAALMKPAAFASVFPVRDVDVQQIEEALARISPDCPYEIWYRIGMAIRLAGLPFELGIAGQAMVVPTR
jgi:hypothetical protein